MSKTVSLAKVIKNDTLNSDGLVKKLVLSVPLIAEQAKPGQFVQLKITGDNNYDPLLRRPFSISDADREQGTISIIYRVVGRGTTIMAAAKPDDYFSCLGPLGKGFSLQGKTRLLVGGGMGLAPLVFLAKELSQENSPSSRPSILLGGRNEQELFWLDIFRDKCRDINITTDDGSLGFKGVVTEHLPEILNSSLEKIDLIYACGPRPMLAKVAGIAEKFNIACQVSLEEHMACGLGACLSCTCAGADGNRRKICSDGPVFDAGEVAW